MRVRTWLGVGKRAQIKAGFPEEECSDLGLGNDEQLARQEVEGVEEYSERGTSICKGLET